MSTQFNENFDNGDLIEAGHIKQVFDPINDLEDELDQLQTALTAGTDGQILQADSAAPSGVSWTDPPSGGGSSSTTLVALEVKHIGSNITFTGAGSSHINSISNLGTGNYYITFTSGTVVRSIVASSWYYNYVASSYIVSGANPAAQVYLWNPSTSSNVNSSFYVQIFVEF